MSNLIPVAGANQIIQTENVVLGVGNLTAPNVRATVTTTANPWTVTGVTSIHYVSSATTANLNTTKTEQDFKFVGSDDFGDSFLTDRRLTIPVTVYQVTETGAEIDAFAPEIEILKDAGTNDIEIFAVLLQYVGVDNSVTPVYTWYGRAMNCSVIDLNETFPSQGACEMSFTLKSRGTFYAGKFTSDAAGLPTLVA